MSDFTHGCNRVFKSSVNSNKVAGSFVGEAALNNFLTGGGEALIVPINIEELEVLCSNCYETIAVHEVDSHSLTCNVAVNNLDSSLFSVRSSQFKDEESAFKVLLQECNEKIFKIIQTFLRKLEN